MKNRGILLTLLLLLLSFYAVFNAYGIFIFIKGMLRGDSFSGQSYLDLGISFAVIISVIGLWFWKKWAVYLFFIQAAVSLLSAIITTTMGLIGFHNLGDPLNLGIMFSMMVGFLSVIVIFVVVWKVFQRKLEYRC